MPHKHFEPWNPSYKDWVDRLIKEQEKELCRKYPDFFEGKDTSEYIKYILETMRYAIEKSVIGGGRNPLEYEKEVLLNGVSKVESLGDTQMRRYPGCEGHFNIIRHLLNGNIEGFKSLSAIPADKKTPQFIEIVKDAARTGYALVIHQIRRDIDKKERAEPPTPQSAVSASEAAPASVSDVLRSTR